MIKKIATLGVLLVSLVMLAPSAHAADTYGASLPTQTHVAIGVTGHTATVEFWTTANASDQPLTGQLTIVVKDANGTVVSTSTQQFSGTHLAVNIPNLADG